MSFEHIDRVILVCLYITRLFVFLSLPFTSARLMSMGKKRSHVNSTSGVGPVFSTVIVVVNLDVASIQFDRSYRLIVRQHILKNCSTMTGIINKTSGHIETALRLRCQTKNSTPDTLTCWLANAVVTCRRYFVANRCDVIIKIHLKIKEGSKHNSLIKYSTALLLFFLVSVHHEEKSWMKSWPDK